MGETAKSINKLIEGLDLAHLSGEEIAPGTDGGYWYHWYFTFPLYQSYLIDVLHTPKETRNMKTDEKSKTTLQYPDSPGKTDGAWRSTIVLAAILTLIVGVATASLAQTPSVESVTEYLKTQTRNSIVNGHRASVMWLAFPPDGKTLASSSRDTDILIWDVDAAIHEKEVILKTIKHHTADVYCVAYSPDGKLLASAGWDGLLCLWNVPDYDLNREINVGVPLRNCAFSPDSKTLACCGEKGTVQLYDVETGELKRKLEGQKEKMKAVEFSSDDRFVVCGGMEMPVRMWNPETGEVLHVLESNEESFEAITISPDAKFVAGNSSFGPVLVWDAATGNLLHTLTGHVQEGDSLVFRPDGKILASGNKDKTITLWDTKTWKPIDMLIGNDSRIESMAYSPDGKLLVNGGGGGSRVIKFWYGLPSKDF